MSTKLEAAARPLHSVETIKYWADAYSNPASGEHFQGHGMVVALLREYASLREALAEQQAAEPHGAIQRVRKALADRKFREAADTEGLLRMAANVIAEDGTILKHMEGKQAAEPVEKLGERCIDGGTCHHKCKDKCFRRECCSPLSGHAGPWAYPAPTHQPLTIPRDVVEAAQLMQDGDYRGPLFLARKVFDWVAAHDITGSKT